MVNVDNTKQQLANTYASLGTFFGLATDDPGTTATPAHEASGGGYARVATTWSPGAGGLETGTNCTINANAGTYTFAILCSAKTGNNMIDNCTIGNTVLSSAGQIVFTPSYVQS
jgi:hypothetical protein